MLRVLCAALVVSWATLMSLPAWAVVPANIQITSGGNALGNSTVELFASDRPAPGERPIARGTTDASGNVRLNLADEDARDRRRCRLIVIRDAQGREVGRLPCFIIPLGDATTVLDARSGRTGDVTVIRQDGQARGADSALKLGLEFGYSLGSVDTRVTRNNATTEGAAIDVRTPSLRPDLRWYPPALRRVGNFGGFNPSDCYLGLQGAIGLDDGDVGLNSDQHPGAPDGVVDTTLRREFKGAITPMVGCTLAKLPNHGGRFDLQLGPRISFLDWTFVTDETAGGGTRQQVEKSETKVGGAFGLEYKAMLDEAGFGGPGNLGNLGDLGSMRPGFRAGVWGEYVPGTDINFTSPNFPYRAEADGAWLWTFLIGGFLAF